MLKLWPVVGILALLASCASRHDTDLADAGQSELELATPEYVDDAWRDAHLETTPTACALDAFTIVCPPLEWYDRACPKAWACLGWRGVGVGKHRRSAPVAYISPRAPRISIPHLAVHEDVHAETYCYGRGGTGKRPDPYDAAHSDPLVWAGKSGSRPDSVEQRAQRLIDVAEWPVECLSPEPDTPTEGPVEPAGELRDFVADFREPDNPVPE